MKKIPLTQNKVALIDDDDFEQINQHKWCAFKPCNIWYAVRSIWDEKKTVFMHREILGLKFGDGKMTDHKNGNGLDNRRENLRNCTAIENAGNQKSRIHSSKFKGVSRWKRDNKWQANIMYKQKTIYLGLFDNEIDAAKAYDVAAKKYFGEFAYLNFPKEQYA